MGQWAYHWLVLDLWYPVWPNLAASLIVYTFVVLKLRAIRELHEETKRMHERFHHEHMEALSSLAPEVNDAGPPPSYPEGGGLLHE